jgi:creatinine amidohydrolase
MASLAGLTWPDVAARAAAGAVLVVPVGSTEQHGPHLPLSTDADVAAALCARLGSERNVLVAPVVAYGSSGEHAGFAGTLSIGQEATELLLVELGRSATETFRSVVFVNGHGGNHAAVCRAVDVLRAEGREVSAFHITWEGDAHAGRTETALQLAITPSAVVLERNEAGNTAPVATLMPQLRRHGVRAVSGNGVLGDPAGADAAQGEALLVGLLAQLIRHVDRIEQ